MSTRRSSALGGGHCHASGRAGEQTYRRMELEQGRRFEVAGVGFLLEVHKEDEEVVIHQLDENSGGAG